MPQKTTSKLKFFLSPKKPVLRFWIMLVQRVLILLWKYLLVKEEELFYWWKVSKFLLVAFENIHFSTLLAAGDVSRGGTSATQRQKFHTDDVKYVRNLVRSPDWLKEQLHCFSYCLRMTDKRQKATKVKCKHDESLTKQSIFVDYSLLYNNHLTFTGARSQMNTTLYQNRPGET